MGLGEAQLDMKFKVTQELVDRVGRGDKAAITTLLEASHRSVHNILFRTTGDRGRARDLARRAFKHVMGRLSEATAPGSSWPAYLLDVTRDAAFDALPGEVYRDTVFARARDLITEPVEVDKLPTTFLDQDEMWGQDFDTGFKASLSPTQLLVLELIFIERCPIAQVAEALEVSEAMLGSFVYGVFDALGDMSHLDHRDGCTPDLFLGIKIVGLEADPEGLALLESEHASCYSCLTVIRRCLKIIRLFQIDSRLAAKADPGLVDEVAAVPARKAAPMVAPTGRPMPTVPVRALPPPQDGVLQRAGRLLVAGTILTAFTFAAFKMVDPSRFQSQIQMNQVKQGPKVLGTFSNPFVSNQAIHTGMVIQSARNHRTDVVLEGGTALLLQPGAQVKVFDGRVVVLKGRVGIAAPRGAPLIVDAEKMKTNLEDGDLLVEREPGKTSRLAVLKGGVALAAGPETVRVETLRQANLDEATMKLAVVDIEGDQLTSARQDLPARTAVAALTSSNLAASSAGATAGHTGGPALGTYPAANGPALGLGGGAGSDTGGPAGTGGTGSSAPAAGAGRTGPATGSQAAPRGYKDYF